jgi:hypothetical protein
MRCKLVVALAVLGFSATAFAQSANDPSRCEALTGDEKDKCLDDQASQNPEPSEVPASTGGTSSSDSSPSGPQSESDKGIPIPTD